MYLLIFITSHDNAVRLSKTCTKSTMEKYITKYRPVRHIHEGGSIYKLTIQTLLIDETNEK